MKLVKRRRSYDRTFCIFGNEKKRERKIEQDKRERDRKSPERLEQVHEVGERES